MSCQPSPSKSATQTPGPNSSRLMEMPLLPLKWANLMPADAVTFVNSIAADCGTWACKLGVQKGLLSANSRKNAGNRGLVRVFLFDFENAQRCTPVLPPVRCLNRVPSEPPPTVSISTSTARNCPGFQLTFATPLLTPTRCEQGTKGVISADRRPSSECKRLLTTT